MTERTIPGDSTEAHTIVLHSLIRDMSEVLITCVCAWMGMTVYFAITAVGDLLDRTWGALLFHGLLCISCASTVRGFWRRWRKYHVKAGAR